MKSFKLNLSETEKQQLKQSGLKISRLNEFAPDEISVLLDCSQQRAMEIAGLIAFQSIPSVGPKFAHDLISIGYYNIADLSGKQGHVLFDELERTQGFWTDPCVEDQFWLVVHYADNGCSDKKWWDFTSARKAFRTVHGYPASRPARAWYEISQVAAY